MHTYLSLLLFALAILSGSLHGDELSDAFQNPPAAARPGVYWYFMDGNQNRDEMIADLQAMKDVGIGSVLFLEVDLGMPRGPVRFMSEPWQDNIAHAFVEAGRMGLEVILGTGPGWSGSGGSWVKANDSMQHLLGSSRNVTGPSRFDAILDVPPPHPPNHFAGMNASHAAERETWFEDVAVIAFPTPAGNTATFDQVNIKTLRDVQPYSIRQTLQRFVEPCTNFVEPDQASVIDRNKIVDLTTLLQPDGRIRWNVPEGDWTLMRFVSRSTGQTTRPAPQTGHGFETNKFDRESYQRHWDNFQAKLIQRIEAKGGPLQPGTGLTTIHLDSWEMSSQNWTARFREEFQQRRKYDPLPFYPAYMGLVVGSLEHTERFLWDLRKTSQELVLEEYAGAIKQIAHQHGLLYSNEPYDMNPAGDIDLGSVADIPMCEFWNAPHDTQYSCIEAVSIAHTMGPQIVKAEAFTSSEEAFAKHPANMKNQTDWALAIGINGIVFHTFQHQALGDREQPGMTMGPYGVQWHRNQTYWEFLPAYHEYLTRCSHLLRQGEAVADILYLTPEGAPHIFEAPEDATEGIAKMRDKRGYAFDAVSPRILAMRGQVEDGSIAFPGGSQYRLLVLPNVPSMTPETLKTIKQLVEAGATVIGNPPIRSPSLVGYPHCDTEVSSLAKSIWGGVEVPAKMTRAELGNGSLFWGGDLASGSGLYPSYQATTQVLAELGLPMDFSSPSGKLRYLHRRTDDCDFYFVSNRTNTRVATEGIFRIDGPQPQLWDAVTGIVRELAEYEARDGVTSIPLVFEPYQSYFVVFPHAAKPIPRPNLREANFPVIKPISQVDGPWNVAFDPAHGGPAVVTLDRLQDWTDHSDAGIRYYSGVATYHKRFDLPMAENPGDDTKLYLDVGTVHDLCRVRLNGRDLGVIWTAPWRADITGVVKASNNELEIDVVNGWANRLIGDLQEGNRGSRQVSWPSGLLGGTPHPAGRYSFVTHQHYQASSPLLPAGLLGPVTVLREETDRNARTTGTPAATTSFEKAGPGPFMTLDTELGTWTSDVGRTVVDQRHAKTGRHCLQLTGGDKTTVTLNIADSVQTSGDLSFWAERWTAREPFSFRLEKNSGNGWTEIYNGDSSVRVGREFLNHVRVSLADTHIQQLRFTCTSPPDTGILIDDVRIAPASQQQIVSVEVVPFTLPALVGAPASLLAKLRIVTTGVLNPLTLTELEAKLEGVHNIESLQIANDKNGASFPLAMPNDSNSVSHWKLTPLQLDEGENIIYLNGKLKTNANIDQRVGVAIESVAFGNGQIRRLDAPPTMQRMGIAVRNAGADGVHTYRIPGLATTNQRTLIGVYDVRRRNGGDLPGDIDVGMSRSTNGGRSWEPMRIIMDMGDDPTWNYDGIGDPAVLVDRNTGTIWVAATWSHGNRSWHGSGPGLKPEETGQLMLVRSDDDGVTWSKPINITSQIKQPQWCFVLQGPGKGITMSDGTLVFAAQYQDPPEQHRLPHSTIIYSKDHGATWQVGEGAFDDTTESQVVEIEPGVLMLNCRYNRKSARVIMTTQDMGRTWQDHPTSKQALIEPLACMASLINVDREIGRVDRGRLLFSNPNRLTERSHISIKASPDRGLTWPEPHWLLLDEGVSAGYSCLSMIDETTVGILYEGSQAQLTFQRIPLRDLLGDDTSENSTAHK